MTLKTLTLLHSNDIHGDFLPTVDQGITAGGVAQISGYVKQERAKNPATLYCVAGDMFRGSVMDSEFKGISTIDIMNMIEPDIATLGNHEVDYGVPHLLFLEKYADFPIINANMYLKRKNRHLFTGHKVVEVDGLRVLFIGLVTPTTAAQTAAEELIGELVDFGEPLPEVERICSAHDQSTIDLTVVPSHLGWEADCALAEAIDPAWGVDLIVGGHSHLMFKEPDVVNGIPIVQLGMGSRHIGRFDLQINTDTHQLQSYEWRTLRLTPNTAPADEALAEQVSALKRNIDEKYNRVLIELDRPLTHPNRYRETELGNLFCDLFKIYYDVDIVLFSSSNLRGETLGPVVTLDDLMAMMPYDGPVTILQATGAQVEQAVHYLMRDENWQENPKFFQINHDFHIEYDRTTHQVVKLELSGKPLESDRTYYLAIDEYHYITSQKNFGLTHKQIAESGRAYSFPMGYRMAALHCFASINDARKRAASGDDSEPSIVYAGRATIDPTIPLDSSVEGRIIIHHTEGFYKDHC